MPVMRKPDSTKKRSTPAQPNSMMLCNAPGWRRGEPKWKRITERIATPRSPSSSGIWPFLSCDHVPAMGSAAADIGLTATYADRQSPEELRSARSRRCDEYDQVLGGEQCG